MSDVSRNRVALVNLGCRVNRVELDAMATELQRLGCVLCGQREADAIVINTCAVTGEAQAKTRKAVRRATKLPQHPLVVATGCVANLFAGELREAAPGVIVEKDKERVASVVARQLGIVDLDLSGIALPMTERTTPTGRTRPGIKIQDGCDNRCTFCIVWKARGKSRSVSVEKVLADVRAAQQRGAHEVVLTGINLGNYHGSGQGEATQSLPELLQTILRETDVDRIRLSSIEPPEVTDELLDTMAAAGERIAPFLHICLQSGCDRTLREMGRLYDSAFFADVVHRTRETVPDMSLGTDLIVGFPGESDEDFAQSLAFCEQMAFSRMHVFRYSKRPGTEAAERPDQVHPQVIAQRSDAMLELADRMRLEQARARIGAEELVVVQDRGRGVSGGLFDAVIDDEHPIDSIVRVRVKDVLPDATLDARA